MICGQLPHPKHGAREVTCDRTELLLVLSAQTAPGLRHPTEIVALADVATFADRVNAPLALDVVFHLRQRHHDRKQYRSHRS